MYSYRLNEEITLKAAGKKLQEMLHSIIYQTLGSKNWVRQISQIFSKSLITLSQQCKRNKDYLTGTFYLEAWAAVLRSL